MLPLRRQCMSCSVPSVILMRQLPQPGTTDAIEKPRCLSTNFLFGYSAILTTNFFLEYRGEATHWRHSRELRHSSPRRCGDPHSEIGRLYLSGPWIKSVCNFRTFFPNDFVQFFIRFLRLNLNSVLWFRNDYTRCFNRLIHEKIPISYRITTGKIGIQHFHRQFRHPAIPWCGHRSSQVFSGLPPGEKITGSGQTDNTAQGG